MGNSFNNPPSYIDNCLKFDRILDADNQVYLGIGIGHSSLKISSQAIRFGDFRNKYYRLHNFTQENGDKLSYNFEDDVLLTLKKDENRIKMELIKLNNPNKIHIIKDVDPVIVKMFKPIKFLSYEIDKICDLFSSVN